MAKKKFFKELETNNKEYCVVFVTEDSKVGVHIGYYEATFDNKQIDELISALKQAKKDKR